MKERKLFYRVGGHAFCVVFKDECNDESLIPSFSRFRINEPSEPLLFILVADDSFSFSKRGEEIGQFDCGGCNHGVYCTDNDEYQYEISDVQGVLCSYMQASPDFKNCNVSIKGKTWNQRNYGLNNALMMTYAFASADQLTMLMHASVIRHQGKGYLMTAPSGTGKSTHTRLWYDNIPGCDLMNDDNPEIGRAHV